MAGKKGSARGARKRRGKAEDVTGEKEGGAKVRRVEPTQMKLPSGKRILECVASIEGYDGKINSLVGARRKQMGVIKAEGIDPKTITDLIKLKKMDQLDFERRMRELGVGLKEMGYPVQLSVFDVAFGDSVAQATAEGKQRGTQGLAVECQWPEGTPEFQAYMDAYTKAEAGRLPIAQEDEAEEEAEEETEEKAEDA